MPPRFYGTTQMVSEKEAPTSVMGLNDVVIYPANSNNDTNFVDRDNVVESEQGGLQVTGDHVLGLTTFPVEEVYSTEIDAGRPAYAAVDVNAEYQDVKKFFERPRLIGAGSLSTVRGVLGYLQVSEPISEYWPAAAVNRLNGVFGYRCTIKFTVTVAATPFQQSLLALSFQYGAHNGSTNNLARHNFPALVTNLPHARINLADQTMCEVSIPYISPYEFFELGNVPAAGGDNASRVYSYGVASLNQVLPYYTLPSGAPSYKIYISLHDMELFGAIPVATNTVIPQSGGKVAKINGVAKAQEEERKPKGNKFVSTTAKVATAGCLLASVGNALSDNPDGAAKYLQSATVCNSVAKSAESMGYSKPVSLESHDKVFASETTHDFNVDMPSNAVVAGPFQSNALVINERVSGTDIDEMDLDFVLGNYCQAFHGSMSTADAGGTVLYATNLCPTSLWFRSKPAARPGGNLAMPASAPVGNNCFQPTALCYFSQMFRYWRGSIKFRFTFAKTKFHAGRVIAAYVPATFDTVATGVLSNTVPAPEIGGGFVQPFQYSTIFDLKDDSVFEFEVPYVCSRPFLSTLGTSGGVTLSVVDPLLVTGETSGTIDYLVEVCAGSDYRLSDFIGSGLGPCSTISGPTGLVVYQSGLEDDEILQYTSGERFNSLKQLAMIPHMSVVDVSPGSASITAMPPFYYCPTFSPSASMPNTTSAYAACATSNLIARCYAYCSGSTMYYGYSSTPAGVFGTLSQNVYDRSNPIPTTSDTRNKTGAHKPRVIKSGYNATIIAKAPSYQKFSMIPCNSVNWNANYVPSTAPINGSNFAPASYRLELSNISSTIIARLSMGYAAGDDARFFAYIGPPPVWLLQSTQTSNLEASAYGNWN